MEQKDLFDELHSAVAKELLNRVKSGEASAAELGVAVRMLKDNNATLGVITTDHPLANLLETLPFEVSEHLNQVTTVRNYKKEYRDYHGTPEQIKRRAARVMARRKMTKKYGKRAVRGKDIDHKDRNPTNNSYSNLRIQSKNKNRGRNK